jgi:cytochrome P450
VRDKKAGLTEEASDMVSIMLWNEMFKDDEEKIIDEIIGLFLAGTQTVRITTTNMMCYLE